MQNTPLLLLLLLYLLLLLSSTYGIAAQTDAQQMRGASFDFSFVKPQQRLYAGRYALIIGASRYTAGWQPLPGVISDRNAFASALQQRGFTVVKLDDPTKAQIIQGVDAFISHYGRKKDNLLLIIYSGHGETLTLDDNRQMGYIVPVDAPLTQLDRNGFLDKAISMHYFEQVALEISAKHVLFLFDSCFSGSIFEAMRGSGAISADILALSSKPARLFITSGSAQQKVPDYSLFRRYFEAAIAGAADLNRDGYISGTELGFFLRGKVANESAGKQTPLFAKMLRHGFYEGDVLFESPLGVKSATTTATLSVQPETAHNRTAVTTRTTQRFFKDCETCPTMVTIPAGEFAMGSPLDELERNSDELQAVKTTIEYPFALSQFEITQQQWKDCFAQGGCSQWIDSKQNGDPRRPVTQVSWLDANEYLQWLSFKSGKQYRFPTEKEWEYAARAGATTARYWGNKLGRNHANCHTCGSAYDGVRTSTVGAFKPNYFGLYDILGNVWEWVDNCYQPDPESALGDPKPADTTCQHNTIRGGSYATTGLGVRAAGRAFYPPQRSNVNIGFRVLRKL